MLLLLLLLLLLLSRKEAISAVPCTSLLLLLLLLGSLLLLLLLLGLLGRTLLLLAEGLVLCDHRLLLLNLVHGRLARDCGAVHRSIRLILYRLVVLLLLDALRRRRVTEQSIANKPCSGAL